MIKTMTVTQLRSQIFNVVEAAKVNKQVTEIMLHGEVVAEIVPKKVKKFDWVKYEMDMEKAIKYLRKFDWSDVLEEREKSRINRFPGW